MNTRVRYFKTQNSWIGSKPLQAGTDAVVAAINTVDFEVVISTAGSDKTLLGGQAENLVQAKKLSKEMLATLGVVFSDEIRNRVAKPDTDDTRLADIETSIDEELSPTDSRLNVIG